jgi:hypothetical protein
VKTTAEEEEDEEEEEGTEEEEEEEVEEEEDASVNAVSTSGSFFTFAEMNEQDRGLQGNRRRSRDRGVL